MREKQWQGGREDSRLYKQVRAEKQKELAVHYERIRPFLDERRRRLCAANEAIRFGQGGIRAVAEALGMGQMTIVAGLEELKTDPEPGTEEMTQRQRRSGGSRKSVTSKMAQLRLERDQFHGEWNYAIHPRTAPA
ncbi:MAG: hypothetical protein RBS57_10265 [Desulforhabdus sp.]|jgi:hypothetical protein|nr:hypothetical protein [Desulforhabdus sp.]